MSRKEKTWEFKRALLLKRDPVGRKCCKTSSSTGLSFDETKTVRGIDKFFILENDDVTWLQNNIFSFQLECF